MSYLSLFLKTFFTGIALVFAIRELIGMIILYRIGKHYRRKKKKRTQGQTFREWFFYDRFDDIVPVTMVFWQVSVFIAYSLCCVTIIVLHFADPNFVCYLVMDKIYFWLTFVNLAGDFIFTLKYKNFKAGGWKF